MGAPADPWSPARYARFRGLRLRPALDLLAQVPELPEGPVVDLGCGDGAVGPALALRFPDRILIGLDASETMLQAAAEAGAYQRLIRLDITDWRPEVAPALIFSNAALQWLADPASEATRLAGLLPPGGVLAVQMPGQTAAPSHVLARETAERLWGALPDLPPAVAPPAFWHRQLARFGRVNAWESQYLQPLPPREGAHPVRAFTESTYLLPLLAGRSPAERAAYLAAYDAALAEAYPLAADGGALLPFRRVFFTLTRA